MIVKVILVLACSISGFFIAYFTFPASEFPSLEWWARPAGVLGGLLIALFVIKLEQDIRKLTLRVILGGVGGMLLGLLIAFLLAYGLNFVGKIQENQQIVPWVYALLTGIMGYLGLVLGSKKVEEFSLFGFGQGKEKAEPRILDTSVIIDGRIADICETGFIEGTLTVPRFVLEELQYIADSADSLKRSRGRRGLDILNRMQRIPRINIEVVDQDFPKLKGVDAKLIALARKINGQIVTNDFNLNKVAELQGVRILNVNELANALRPVVLPGEPMAVKIIKEGKEPGQGVGYLDDGTMIVVDHANRHIGQVVDTTVTSVLQTAAGRMIFAELKAVLEDRKSQASAVSKA
ncbi:MAG TPA: PIN domain-containing protein [Syntrophales bacterium]|nr:PIN domain-containing protein [Syntrophales bacterium]HOM06422.1 PIN domain-containing protein [Syntrophales bacterium]HON99127.1 PIN domain-containing protein [Syntrophales bacterium]HPC00235.1 PIN domain-containing protein [Syntrophales bacterium]HPQ05898.1 PIN domain-containing protein [Syntrophales bacterium]